MEKYLKPMLQLAPNLKFRTQKHLISSTCDIFLYKKVLRNRCSRKIFSCKSARLRRYFYEAKL